MNHSFQGPFFRSVRGLVRLIYPIKALSGAEKVKTPACYVAHYQNSFGPVYSMLHMPTPVHPWTLAPFCKIKDCYRHYMHFTFTQRFGWPKIAAAPVCALLSCVIAPLYRSMGAIPVYRGSTRIAETMKRSVDCLIAGESIIIFPDIDYTSPEPLTKEIYHGFLHLEKSYFKKTGTHLPFIPVFLSAAQKSLEIGDPIRFKGLHSFKEEQEQVAQALVDAMNRKAAAQEQRESV